VNPSLATNPPAAPLGLDAGTNAFTNLPAIPSTGGLPVAPMITNPVTPESLPAPLPTGTNGPLIMPSAGTNNFGLRNNVTDIPLTAEALAKAGNKIVPNVIAKNAKRMNIDEVVQYALAHNPDVLTAVQNIERASGNFINVRAGLLPRATISPAYTLVGPQHSAGSDPAGLQECRHP